MIVKALICGLKAEAKMVTITGVATMAAMVSRNKSVPAAVNNLLTYSFPDLVLRARTICGIKTASIIPAASRLYTMFGRVFATWKDAIAPALDPRAATSRAERTNPSPRDTSVPEAMTMEDFSNVCSLGASPCSSSLGLICEGVSLIRHSLVKSVGEWTCAAVPS